MCVLSCVFVLVLSQVNAGKHDDEDLIPNKRADVFPAPFSEWVPFGHIPLEGVGDPFSKAKMPIDPLELSMRSPKNRKEAEEILKNYGRRYIAFINDDIVQDKSILSPRDQYLKETMVNPLPANETRLKWYDLAALQTRNAMRRNMEAPPAKRKLPNAKDSVQHGPVPGAKGGFFLRDSFELRRDRAQLVANWTTCNQFAVGAIFSPNEIVNLKWTPFYIWSTRHEESVEHTFQYPTKKLVNEFRTIYRPFLNKTIDWNSPKLHMKGITEALLIAADNRGLFDCIVKHEIPESAKQHPITIPVLSLRMKIEDPYLAMTFCEHNFAMLMAIAGKEPTKYKEMKQEASTIKFVGIGRPVWRDYDAEKLKEKEAQAAKQREMEADRLLISAGIKLEPSDNSP